MQVQEVKGERPLVLKVYFFLQILFKMQFRITKRIGLQVPINFTLIARI